MIDEKKMLPFLYLYKISERFMRMIEMNRFLYENYDIEIIEGESEINVFPYEKLTRDGSFLILEDFDILLRSSHSVKWLRQHNIQVFGLPILFDHLKNEKFLSVYRRPLYCRMMEGFVITFCGYENSLELFSDSDMVHHLGGSVRSELCDITTHLIVKCVSSKKYSKAIQNQRSTNPISIVNRKWLLDLNELAKNELKNMNSMNYRIPIVNYKQFLLKYQIKPFYGLTFLFIDQHQLSISQLIELKRLIEENDGQWKNDEDLLHSKSFPSYLLLLKNPETFSVAQIRNMDNFEEMNNMKHLSFDSMKETELTRISLSSPNMYRCLQNFYELNDTIFHWKSKEKSSDFPPKIHLINDRWLQQKLVQQDRGKTIKKKSLSISASSSTILVTTNNKNSPNSVLNKKNILVNSSKNNNRSNKRYLLYRELVDTEFSYFKQLHAIIYLFKYQIITNAELSDISITEIKEVFGDIESIYELHCDILIQLILLDFHLIYFEMKCSEMKLKRKWSLKIPFYWDKIEEILKEKDKKKYDWVNDQPSIGNIFVNYITKFRQKYPPYLNYVDKSLQRLSSLEKRHLPFQKFLQETSLNFLCARQKLNDLLLLPMQRLPRYQLLFEKIEEHSPSDNADSRLIPVALTKIKEVLFHINENKKQAENYVQLFKLFNLIDKCPPQLLAANRQLIQRIDCCEMLNSIEFSSLVLPSTPKISYNISKEQWEMRDTHVPYVQKPIFHSTSSSANNRTSISSSHSLTSNDLTMFLLTDCILFVKILRNSEMKQMHQQIKHNWTQFSNYFQEICSTDSLKRHNSEKDSSFSSKHHQLSTGLTSFHEDIPNQNQSNAHKKLYSRHQDKERASTQEIRTNTITTFRDDHRLITTSGEKMFQFHGKNNKNFFSSIRSNENDSIYEYNPQQQQQQNYQNSTNQLSFLSQQQQMNLVQSDKIQFKFVHKIDLLEIGKVFRIISNTSQQIIHIGMLRREECVCSTTNVNDVQFHSISSAKELKKEEMLKELKNIPPNKFTSSLFYVHLTQPINRKIFQNLLKKCDTTISNQTYVQQQLLDEIKEEYIQMFANQIADRYNNFFQTDEFHPELFICDIDDSLFYNLRSPFDVYGEYIQSIIDDNNKENKFVDNSNECDDDFNKNSKLPNVDSSPFNQPIQQHKFMNQLTKKLHRAISFAQPRPVNGKQKPKDNFETESFIEKNEEMIDDENQWSELRHGSDLNLSNNRKNIVTDLEDGQRSRSNSRRNHSHSKLTFDSVKNIKHQSSGKQTKINHLRSSNRLSKPSHNNVTLSYVTPTRHCASSGKKNLFREIVHNSQNDQSSECRARSTFDLTRSHSSINDSLTKLNRWTNRVMLKCSKKSLLHNTSSIFTNNNNNGNNNNNNNRTSFIDMDGLSDRRVTIGPHQMNVRKKNKSKSKLSKLFTPFNDVNDDRFDTLSLNFKSLENGFDENEFNSANSLMLNDEPLGESQLSILSSILSETSGTTDCSSRSKASLPSSLIQRKKTLFRQRKTDCSNSSLSLKRRLKTMTILNGKSSSKTKIDPVKDSTLNSTLLSKDYDYSSFESETDALDKTPTNENFNENLTVQTLVNSCPTNKTKESHNRFSVIKENLYPIKKYVLAPIKKRKNTILKGQTEKQHPNIKNTSRNSLTNIMADSIIAPSNEELRNLPNEINENQELTDDDHFNKSVSVVRQISDASAATKSSGYSSIVDNINLDLTEKSQLSNVNNVVRSVSGYGSKDFKRRSNEPLKSVENF
ncbi:hypothetical protein SNEBB_004866 [Seison nebaliae]|nr:hypothetical protein SNEBB_004866 [Seison nebaliae]